MQSLLKNFLLNENGATSIEYALISALVGVVMVSSITSFGNSLNATFVALQSEINSGPGAPMADEPTIYK